MTIRFENLASRETALRSALLNRDVRGTDNDNEPEDVGVLIAIKGRQQIGGGLFASRHRNCRTLAAGQCPWLEIFTEFPPCETRVPRPGTAMTSLAT